MKGTVILAMLLGVTLKGFVTEGKKYAEIKGNHVEIGSLVRLRVDQPEVWVALSKAERFPIINNGDLIMLRRALIRGTPQWFRCATSNGDCNVSNCPGANFVSKAKWSVCTRETFKIVARGKPEGWPINSGDTVAFAFPARKSSRKGHVYVLDCSVNSWKCHANDLEKISGPFWLNDSDNVFEIYSRSSVDESPIQYGDIIALKYNLRSSKAWVSYSSGRFYSKDVTDGQYNKMVSAKENSPTGFQIFKPLP